MKNKHLYKFDNVSDNELLQITGGEFNFPGADVIYAFYNVGYEMGRRIGRMF